MSSLCHKWVMCRCSNSGVFVAFRILASFCYEDYGKTGRSRWHADALSSDTLPIIVESAYVAFNHPIQFKSWQELRGL